MKDDRALARGWIRKGDSDLADAQRTVKSDGPYDTACFHAQQAAEKYLKALLACGGQAVPRTHDLEELLRFCLELKPATDLASLDLAELSGYAVEMRYDPEFWPEKSIAEEALTLAERVRSIVVPLLPADER